MIYKNSGFYRFYYGVVCFTGVLCTYFKDGGGVQIMLSAYNIASHYGMWRVKDGGYNIT